MYRFDRPRENYGHTITHKRAFELKSLVFILEFFGSWFWRNQRRISLTSPLLISCIK